MKKIFLTFSLLICSLIILQSCDTKKQVVLSKIVIQGEAQGTYYSISYYDSQNRNLSEQIDSLLQQFDLSASNYNEASIISKVNRNEPVELDSIFMGNFNLAMEVSKATGGLFDITVRPLVEAWGFGKEIRRNMSTEMVDSIMQFVGYQKIVCVNGKMIKEDPRVQLDFNAIAQGYSVDVVAQYLELLNIKHYLVDIGGEVFASEMKPDSTLWQVGVELPVDSAEYGSKLSTVIPLSKNGLATSGNYRKFYRKDGAKIVHTINPLTGYPIDQRLLSATVIAKTAAKADAYATAFMVMGLEKGIDFLKNHQDLAVYFIYSDSVGNYQYFVSPQLKSIIQKP
jgi:thiamine biosynthesis lipoprotein